MRILAAAVLVVFMTGCDSNSNDNNNPPPITQTNPRVQLNNQSASTIITFQWSDCSATAWGGDRLGNDVIGPGSNRTFELNASGCYDFQAVNDNGIVQNWMGQQANYNSTIQLNFTN